jgi:signal transduction histidine kinase
MSLLDILRLVGFATGTALHFYLAWLLALRRGLRDAERALFGLGLCLGAWHLGNLGATLYGLAAAPSWWAKLSDVVAYSALAFLPPLLAHAHFRLWDSLEANAPRRLFAPLILLGYVPALVVPWAIVSLWRDPYEPAIERLAPLILPFIIWIVFIFGECAVIDLRLARRAASTRERGFFRAFGRSLAAIGALFLLTYVLGARHWGTLGLYLDAVARLSSVVPTAIIAYYIYRYRYLELVIRQSFVYALVAAVVMMIYVYGIRRLSAELEARASLRSEVVEAVLILGLIFLSGPLRRVTERYLQRLFKREVGLYRELVAQVGAAASTYGEMAHFAAFAERQLSESLSLDDVRILARATARGAEAELCRWAEERQLAQVEDETWLARVRAQACYVLWREGRVVGLLLVGGTRMDLTVEKREVLAVLAGHLAVAVENCLLLEEKVKLERELASRERLAALGQMAATVAHEIKNPLSSIKSIVQVMREDESLGADYSRDLALINGEIDRLNRTVSQLLSFSRPAVVAASSAPLRAIVDGVLALLRPELSARGARVETRLQVDPRLAGAEAAALREALTNLVLNAAQALEGGGEIRIESDRSEDGRLRISVIDDGPGVKEELREKVFEPFFTTRQRGTGLGLAIVARRLRELDGTIALSSPVEAGRGARFDLLLPSRPTADSGYSDPSIPAPATAVASEERS